MSKIASFSITLLILLLSLVGTFIYTKVIISNNYTIFDIFRGILCFLGIMSFCLYLLKNKIFYFLNIFWFLPQLIIITQRCFDFEHSTFFDKYIYNSTVVFQFGFTLAWAIDKYSFIVFAFNIFALIGLFISLSALPNEKSSAVGSE